MNVKKINLVKRGLLIIPLSGIVVVAVIPEMRLNYYLVTTFLSSSMYIILLNFPVLGSIMHTKPIYYEDLEDSDVEEHSERRVYQHLFIRIIQPPLAMFVAILAAYLIYKVKHSTLSPFEIVGIIGGNISIYYSGQKLIGQFLLWWLKWRKDKMQTKRKMSIEETPSPKDGGPARLPKKDLFEVV
jgi:uncharacterized membrane protein